MMLIVQYKNDKWASKISAFTVSLCLVEDWNSEISYGLRAIHERQGVRTRSLTRVDTIINELES